MPRACAGGIATEAVHCYLRVIPARGNYTVSVFAFSEPDSVPVEVSVPSEWTFEDQTITIEPHWTEAAQTDDRGRIPFRPSLRHTAAARLISDGRPT